MNNNLLSIGEFSKIANVHIKSLRYYDKLGVLKPIYVDPKTNYRYYSYQQLAILDAISTCIDVGIPLKEFNKFMSEDKTTIYYDKLLEQGKMLAEKKINEIKNSINKMEYIKTKKYNIDIINDKIMGPNPLKLEEELLKDNKIKPNGIVMDLGSGLGITSVFLVKEYGFKVYATDLWSDKEENRKFFTEMGLTNEEIIPVKADATDLRFNKNFFDAVISTDSYNYFGRDEKYLDEKLLPFVKKRWIYLYYCSWNENGLS